MKDQFVFGYYDRDLTVSMGIFCLSLLSRINLRADTLIINITNWKNEANT